MAMWAGWWFEFQLLLAAKNRNFSAIRLQMALSGMDMSPALYSKIIADVFKLVLEGWNDFCALPNSWRLFSKRLATSYHLWNSAIVCSVIRSVFGETGKTCGTVQPVGEFSVAHGFHIGAFRSAGT